MKIPHSQEDYLEAILVLSKTGAAVRSVDVAQHMGFSKASISRAMAQLSKQGYVALDASKHITLTRLGRVRAEAVYEKHIFFKDLLTSAGVQDPEASEEACRIEHAISDESFRAVRNALKQRNG